MSPEELWDIIKARIKKFIQGYGRQRVDWRKQQLITLQRKRQRLLRQAIPTSILSIHLPRVERQIQTLQEETVKIAILKAVRTWRERGETDAGYLKKSASARQAQRSVPMLRNPATGDICSNQEQMLKTQWNEWSLIFQMPVVSMNLMPIS
ncbi:hypothetical protein G6F37_014043 [Rhizopus arrhizus]|nr:hypothetical protein G6F37_014043 [Rhizopus arrhizus]